MVYLRKAFIRGASGMTIKEIENLSGMTRANIRFYETEGLLMPQRAQNGYRDYTEDDLKVLKRIKLLRGLGISLEEIKAVHRGEKELQDILKRHMDKLRFDKKELEVSQEICKIMDEDGVCYHTLDAQYYLDALERGAKHTKKELEKDVLPRVKAPWQRFFARELDFTIYSAIATAVLELGFNINTLNCGMGWQLIKYIIPVVIMWLAEPILLSKFSTTLGKWIFGIRVTDEGGQRLSYEAAKERTATLFWHGLGFYVPAVGVWKWWKCYVACTEGQMLEWEDASEIVLRDTKKWRIAAYVGSNIMVITLMVGITFLAEMPRYRGELTTAEFCKNYNRLANYFELDMGEELDHTGKWKNESDIDNVIYMSDDGSFVDPPDFVIVEEDGEVVEISFSVEINNGNEPAPSCIEQMTVSALAYIGAQDEIALFSKDRAELIEYIENHRFENFEYEKAGVKMTCNIEYKGYEDAALFLWPMEEQENYYYLLFKMSKNY